MEDNRKLIFLMDDGTTINSIHHMPFDEVYGLPQEMIDANILYEGDIPEPEIIEGKFITMKYNSETSEIYFEYTDTPPQF